MRAIDRAVVTLASERPEWLPVLDAAVAVCTRVEDMGGEFAGAWVIDELERRTGHHIWVPNLRVLVSYGLVEKVGESTRGGRRAYYRMPAKEAIADALSRLERAVPEVPPRSSARLFLVGAGDSGQPGSDWARRSGDTKFEPESWRSS